MQQDADADGIAQSNQNLPMTQAQADQNFECASNDIQTVTQDANSAQGSGEVSSTHDQPVSTTSGVSSSVNYSDSDDGDEFPVFEYSAESMQVAKDRDESPETTSNEVEQPPAEENAENDEDLVQLDDDDNFGNDTGVSERQADQTHTEHDISMETPVASPEVTGNQSSENMPLLDDGESSEPNATKLNEEKCTEDISESDERITEASEAEPSENLLDEHAEIEENDKNKKSNKNDNADRRIEGMDTEMISEDEQELHDDQASKEHNADKENNNQKSDQDESFKKVSKSNKDRNYRDKKDKARRKVRRSKSSRSSVSRSRSKSISKSKSRSRSRSRLRSRSRSKLRRSPRRFSRSRSRSRIRNRNRRIDRRPRRKEYRGKRQEIQRYDVRTLMADRQPRPHRDKYGRNTSRPPRSLSPRKGKSKSISRSISPGLF